MRKQISCMRLALVALTIGACTNEECVMRQNEGEAGAINFTMSTGDAAGTRTTTTTGAGEAVTSFTADDKVGLFAINAEGDICVNNLYTATGDAFSLTWSTAKPVKVEDAPTAFYAYYPYAEGNQDRTTIAHTILTDQDNEQGYGQSDLLASVLINPNIDSGKEENQTVNLKFYHQLALVQVKVLLGQATEAPRYVKLLNVKPKVTMDLTTETSPTVTLEDAETAIEVFMYKYDEKLDGTDEEKYASYRAVVPAQTIDASVEILEFVLNDKVYQLKHEDGVKYNQGKVRNIVVRAAGKAPEIIINTDDSAIGGWDTSDTAGDITDGEAGFTGDAPKVIGDVAWITSVEDVAQGSKWPEKADFVGWYQRGAKVQVNFKELVLNSADGSVTFGFTGYTSTPNGLYYFLGSCIREGYSKYRLSFEIKAKSSKNLCTVFNLAQPAEGPAVISTFNPITPGQKGSYEHAAIGDFKAGYKMALTGENFQTYAFDFDLANVNRGSETEPEAWDALYDNLAIGFMDFGADTDVAIKNVKFEPVTETPAE